MATETLVPIFGTVPSLDTTTIYQQDAPTQFLKLKSWAPYNRFGIVAGDDGLDSFGVRPDHYLVFREARWPDRECAVCLVSFGDEVSVRLLEGITSTLVTLRVSGDRIPPVELDPHELTVMGVLDGVIYPEFAEVVTQEPIFDWGC